MITFAVDFESYYDKSCSITVLGPLGYFSHPDFDAYMVSVVGDNGYKWVGDPKEFDWGMLEGNRVLSHNAAFDETLYLFGTKKGWWSLVDYKEWFCTADMVAHCGLPRSLKNSSAELFDLEVSKETRDSMLGKRWEDMDDDFKEEVEDYALKDSELCLQIWEEIEDQWPDAERTISNVNRRIVQRGIPIDTNLLKTQKETIALKLFETEKNIPWKDNYPLLSRKAFNEECRKLGITPPESLALTDDAANKWIDKYGDQYLWIKSVRDFRRINALKKKLDSFDYATLSDGRFYGGCMYFGAHTGRWSGSGGNLNLQNLPRGEMFGVTLRHLIKPKEGHKLVVADLSQIEVRTLAWLSEDQQALEEIKEASDIYEVFARRFKLWEGEGVFSEEAPDIRYKTKTMVLGCGYGVGFKRFASISGMSEKEAEECVTMYRNCMPKVVRLWNKLTRSVHLCYANRTPFKYELPSGRVLDYGYIQASLVNSRREYYAKIFKGAKRIPMKLWGGLVAENLSQALARDVFASILVRLEEAGHNIILHVHDEVVIECKEEEANKVLQDTLSIMSSPPSWIPELPIQGEGKIVNQYEK